MEFENITSTYNNVKYAYEKEGIYDTEFIANCIEHGEEFCSNFFAPKSYTKQQLKDIGYELAMDWGGECISIERVVSHNADGSVQVVRV